MEGFSPVAPSSWFMVDYPASYHNGAAGLTFADGRSEIKWLDPRTRRFCAGPILPLSVSSRGTDVYWLQE